jgi:hypothetical protein
MLHQAAVNGGFKLGAGFVVEGHGKSFRRINLVINISTVPGSCH